MSGKAGSSLFAGMNIGETDQPVALSSSAKMKGEATFTKGKNINESQDKTTSRGSSGMVPSGSRFSFIRQTDAAEQTTIDLSLDVSKIDSKAAVSSDKNDLLSQFDMLDKHPSTSGDETKLLSYSDQLAEILPMTTPLDDTVLPTSSHATVEDADTTVFLEEDKTPKLVDLTSKDDNQQKNQKSHFYSDDSINDYEVLDNTESIKDIIKETKYDIVLQPEDHLSLFCSQHSYKLTELRDEKEELERNLCLVYEQVRSKIVSLEENLINLRAEFDEALSNDDYDSAADINEKIEQLISEKYELQCERPALVNLKAKTYLNDVAVFVEKEVDFHHWALGKYHDLEEEQNAILTEHRKKWIKEIEHKKQDVEFEKDEATRSLEHLELDKQHMKKDRTELDNKIDAKLEVFQEKKNQLVEKQKCLEDEIEKFERKIKELKTESKEVGMAINDEETKMKDARKEFESLEAKLKDKSDQIQMEEEVLKAKLEQVEVQEKDLEQTVIQNKIKAERLVKNIDYLVTNKTDSENFIQTSQERTNKNVSEVFLTSLCEDERNDLKNLRIQEKEKTADLQFLELQVFNKEQKIAMKKKRLEEIQNQVPEFEKAKKMAVTDHNFKEAKRLNEIIKQLSSEIETSKTYIEEMENALEEERQNVVVLKHEYEKLKLDAVAAKENHDLEVLIRIVNKIMKLIKDETRINKDSLLETLRKAELDLLKTEFSFLDIPSENVNSKLNDTERQSLALVKEILELDKELRNASQESQELQETDIA